MRHRHINTAEWTCEAIDSALERGGLEDWKDLFQSAKADRELARNILKMARFHIDDGTYALVEGLLKKIQPKLFV